MKTKSVKSINPCKTVIQASYDIVKAHGGELGVHSTVNKGTEFTIQMPVA